jgi:hypothetical protein
MDDPWPRAILTVGLCCIGVGVAKLVSGSWASWLIGLGMVVFGSVLVASLALRYEKPGLDDPRWWSSRLRRVLRFVLAHTWRVVSIAMLLGAALGLVEKLT